MFFAMGADCDCHICLVHGSMNNDVAQIQTRADKKLFLLCAAVQSSSRTFLVLISIFGGKKNLVWTCLHIEGGLAGSHIIATCM